MKKTMVSLLLCCSFTLVGCGGENTQKQIDELSAKIEQLQSDATVSQSTIEELQNQTAAQKEQIEELEQENASQKQQIEDLEKDNLLWKDHVLDGYGLRTDYKVRFNVLCGGHDNLLDYRRRDRYAYVDDVTVSEVDLKLNYSNRYFEKENFFDFVQVGGEWKEAVDVTTLIVVYDSEAINQSGEIVNSDLAHVIREIPSDEFFSEKYGYEYVPIDQNESFIKYTHEEEIKIPSKIFRNINIGDVGTLYVGFAWCYTYADGTKDSEISVGYYYSVPLFYRINYYSVDGSNIGSPYEDWAYKRIVLSEKGFD